MKVGTISLLIERTIDNLTIPDVVLSSVEKHGTPNAVKLSIRISQESGSTLAGGAMEQAQASAQMLPQPLVANVVDTLTNVSNTLSNQQNLIASFDALMKKLGVLVKVGDEVAKVCSSVFSRVLHDLN
jgi:hypothetical protein